MRVKYSWVLAMLLSGCQLTQSTDQNLPEQTNNPPQSVKKAHPESEIAQTPSQSSSVENSHKVQHKVAKVTPQTQKDVWHRIGMQLHMPIPNNQLVNYYRTWYITHPSHLKVVSERAAPFLYLITKKIEKRGLPLELALLPVVESAFDPFAYSHGSAAGLWQIVPGTGRSLGLKRNYWYDGRRDVDAATDAALDYLTQLNKRFDGNWYNTIAAYNSGGGRVSSAIRKNKRLGKPTDFFSLDLPNETSAYVPKLLALADIVAHQKKYGVHIPPIANKPVVELVNPKEQLDLAIAAKYANISVKELQELNPAYNQWATAPEGPYQLLLPIKSIARFEKEVKDNPGRGMKLIRYKVKSGDALISLAKKYNTTPKVIRVANNLTGNTIRVGQYLLIPTSTKNDQVYALSASNRLAKIQSESQGKYKLTHTVKSGDSLWSIARENKVSYRSLAKWNGMGPRDTLRVGQKLVIWKKATDGAIIRTVFYKVRSGDTIDAIAYKFKVSRNDIVKWNGLANQKYIQPGQKLKLYVDVTKVSV
ncbi:Membrane-bound lytic murein transglycosylase D [Vibrio marisflavi CECT 7928]|uniref:Membrane-bound lytic murein transglycosylase D n=1 Tax=Vibrio marisflavi CECT 7928 TaxID=634439 RepID=A0ABN8E5V1_9VIBR|nr:LysM peptidoglycan-binding domain-containing protein [Vibrio marisflavi]CAH0540963.1 Membrane-bound lytic murein transglycosylase D [Vibrio marisflavi CECT 7928]